MNLSFPVRLLCYHAAFLNCSRLRLDFIQEKGLQTDHRFSGSAGHLGTNPTGAVVAARQRLCLFCLPPAGGGAVQYRAWPKALPSWIDCRPVELPGRGRRLGQPPETRADDLVARLADELAADLKPPFALFGHSMGGLLAFELARELRRSGRAAPLALFLSAFPAPHPSREGRRLHDLPRADLLKELADLGGTPPEVLASDDLMDLLLPVIRADLSACESWRYRSEEPLGTPIHALAGSADPRCTPQEMEGWRTETSIGFNLTVFEGGHFFFQHHLDAIANLISSHLAAHQVS